MPRYAKTAQKEASMKYAILALIFVPSLAFGQQLGCYTDNLYNCSTARLTCGVDKPSNYIIFGYTIGDLCARLVDRNADFDALISDYNGLVSNYNGCNKEAQARLQVINNLSAQLGDCGSTVASNSATINSANNYLKQLFDMESKLRKACGSKCKKIKRPKL